MLKFRVENLEEVADEHRSLYAEKEIDGKKVYVLQVEGVAPVERVLALQKKINDFRNTNVRLKDRVSQFLKFAEIEDEVTDDMTPEDIANLLTEKRKELETKLKKQFGGKGDGKLTQEEIDQLVEDRVKQLRDAHANQIKTFETRIKEVETERDEVAGRLENISIEKEVLSVATQRGLRPTAHPDILTRARSVFRLVDGEVRAVDSEGNPIYGMDGTEEMKISEWVEMQATKDAPHLFESNSGSGASGGSAGGRSGAFGPNPWKKDTFNRTRQLQIIKKDPAAAKRLQAEAGVR